MLREWRAMAVSLVRARAWTSILTFVLVARGSFAAPPQPPTTPPSDATVADAKRHFEAGLKLYAERVYAAALTEFEESYRLGGRATALKNVAQCHRELKQFAEAYDAYNQLLVLHGNDPVLKAPEKAAAKKALAELAKIIGTVEILAEPPGAEVSIDGKVVGVTPMRPVHVDLGDHEVKITKVGYEPFAKSVTVVAEQSVSVSAALTQEVTTGRVVVTESSGQAVKVVVDDKELGAAPWEGDLPPGVHVVQLLGEGLASERKTIELHKKERLEIALVALATQGKIDARVTPSIGELSLDGKPLGRGAFTGSIEPGQHVLEATASGYLPQRTAVTIERGKTFAVAVTLVAEPSATDAERDRNRGGGDDEEPAQDVYRGVYGRLAFSYLYPIAGRMKAGDIVAPSAWYDASNGTDGDAPLGGAVTLRVGYNFDPFAVEFIGAFSHSQNAPSLCYPEQCDAPSQQIREDLKYEATGGFAGIGGRVTSRDDVVRMSLGLGVGLAYRHYQLSDGWSGNAWGPQPSPASSDITQDKLVPALTFDADMIIGHTPGTRFVLGVEGWLEMSGTVTAPGAGTNVPSPIPAQISSLPASSSSYVLAKGPAFYIGPHVGFQFGR